MRYLIIVSFLYIVLAGTAFAKVSSPNDFAYGMRLEIDGQEALYEAALPLQVYRGVTRGDLGDLCVFNAQKEMVPFAIIRPPLETAHPAESVQLPIFPVFAGPGKKAENLSLQVKKDKTGAIINVTTDNDSGTGHAIAAYLVDARHVKMPVSALELELRTPGSGLVRKVSVDAGSDLEHWTTISPDTSIVSVRYGDHLLERRTIELGHVKTEYFRVSSAEPGVMPELTGVRARLAVSAREPARQWVSVPATKESVKDGFSEYAFDTAGRMPVDRIRADLPQNNTLVNATFFSRPSKEGPWITRQSSLVYNLRLQGHDVRNADITLPPCSDRYWLVRIDQTGGGLGRGVPKLEFGWIPEKLVFITRGNAPFTLAFGSSRVRVGGGTGNDLLAEFKNLQNENVVAKVAGIGPRTVLGGETALRPGMTPHDWKTAVLWSVLVLGVALLAWMAIRLHRQLK